MITSIALLLLRLLVMIVFVWSGWGHAKDPVASGKDIGFSPPFARLLGIVELLAGLGVGFGVLTRLSALGLMIVMLGAMHRKIFVWSTGFWGKDSHGWHYDLIFFAINLLILGTAGGPWTLTRLLVRVSALRWLAKA
ncbi:MAG: DoxX family protein [Acidobacteriota bacterium]